jgi:hypothetical protein
MKVKIHNHPFVLITQMYLAGSLGIEFAVITYQSMKLLDMVTWNTWGGFALSALAMSQPRRHASASVSPIGTPILITSRINF